MTTIPRSGEFYRHFKNRLYQIVTVAEHTETGEPLVVYQALYGDYRTYARPLAMFVSEVDHEKYPNVSQRYRFEKVMLSNDAVMTETDRSSLSHVTIQEYTGRDAYDNIGGHREHILNPNLFAFMEAGTYAEKLDCLERMGEKVCQEDLDMIYVALDMKRPSGMLKEQLYAVERYLRLLENYDGGRLR